VSVSATRSVRVTRGNSNNVAHPDWGQVGKPYLRVTPAVYADGIGAPVPGPPTRYISNRIFADYSQNLFSENGVTQWGFVWGQLVDHTIGPLPWRTEGPPILITAGNRGELLPAQFERFGRLGDGIITTYVHFEEIPTIRERALEALARHGRARAEFPLCVYTTVRLDDDVATAQRVTTEFLTTYYGGGVHERGAMGLGPAPVVIDTLARYAAAGVTDLCIRFIGNDQLAQLDRFTAEVLPAVAKEVSR